MFVYGESGFAEQSLDTRRSQVNLNTSPDLCLSFPGISKSLSLSLVGGLGGPVDAFASKCVSPAGLVDALTGTQINESHVGLP